MDIQEDAPQHRLEKTPGSRKMFIRSYGCQMNVYDAQRMSDLMARDGFTGTDDIADADLVVLNTCHIRERATEKIYSELGKIRALKAERAASGLDTTVVVAGCVAQAEGDEILRREKSVDLVVGPQNFQSLPRLISRRTAPDGAVHTAFDSPGKFAALPLPAPEIVRRRGPAAFLTIQEGCDKFCTFCVVPYTRGSEMSRAVPDVLAEARALIAGGTRELTLLGQNVNAYHGRGVHGATVDLAELCFRLAELPGLERLRYTTSHPNDVTASLIAAHRDLPMLMPFVHLPVQSGSNRILKAMNRRHDVDRYLDCVAQLRAARPDVALSSDFIVGFPGETTADFEATLDLIRAVGFASSFSFKYSPRPGTPGAERADQIDDACKSERLAHLQLLLEDQRQAFNAGTVGKTLNVLVERAGRHPGQVTGKTPYLQQVQFDGARRDLIGSVVPLRITARAPNSLFGTLDGAVAMQPNTLREEQAA